MLPRGLSANALSMALLVPVTRVSEIIKERRGVTADTAARLARYFGTSARFWLNLQAAYELSIVETDKAKELDKIERGAA